jgi:hypothetical protein
VIEVAEDRWSLRCLVDPLALEYSGSIVKTVGEYVYLRVLPGNEFSVVPDEVRLFHVGAP